MEVLIHNQYLAEEQPMESGKIRKENFKDNNNRFYVADKRRFGCGHLLAVTNPNNERCYIVKVMDIGPDICVEAAVWLRYHVPSPFSFFFDFNFNGNRNQKNRKDFYPNVNSFNKKK